MKRAFLVFASLVLATAAWAQTATPAPMMKSDDTMMKADPSAMKSDTSMMKSEGSMMVSDSDRKMSADPMDITGFNLKDLGPQVAAFTTQKDAMMGPKGQTVVYFFAATWCPDCQATYKDLKANFSKLPMNFKLVFVNYDKNPDLRKKYGITAQHTFLTVGPMGEKKKVWAGSVTVADIVAAATMM